jgi:hypothetical protein
MKNWDPITFSQRVVILALDEMLTKDVVVQLGNWAVHQKQRCVDVADLSER